MTAEDSARLHQRIDTAVEKIEAAAERLTHIEAACPLHTERLVAVELSLFGNGKNGLMTRVDRIEQKARAVWAAIGMVVGLVGAAAGAVGMWWAK